MLEKLEMKINEFKKKQDPRYVGVFMFAVFGIVVLIAMNFANVYGKEKQATTDTYNRAMYEVITNVNNIDTLVAKLRVTSSIEYNTITLTDILAEAALAKDNLSMLPVNQGTLSNVSKYFSQVMGYSQTLIKKLSSGEKLTEAEHKNLKDINEVSNNLMKVLNEIYESLCQGRIKWNEVEKVATQKLSEDKSNLDLGGINKVKDTLEDYEGLIYDGAYSNHIEQANPKALSEKEVTVEQAASKVRECVENAVYEKKIEEIIYLGETNGRLEVYNFEVTLVDQDYKIDVDISKKDGKLVLLMYDRNVDKNTLGIEEAKKKGDEYLAALGLEQFEPTYYLTTDNMTTINYAATQKDVILYPDLIKVKVALDTGEICSVECTGYIFNHIVRENLTPTLSVEQAQSKLYSDMKIDSKRLALIPTDSNNEILTYEFKGTVDDKTFLVYINAKTGIEENVLILLETEGGIVTM